QGLGVADRPPREAAADAEVLQSVQVVLEGVLMAAVEQLGPIGLAEGTNVFPSPEDRAVGRQHQAAQHAQQCGLAASVGSLDEQECPGTELEAQAGEQPAITSNRREGGALQHSSGSAYAGTRATY